MSSSRPPPRAIRSSSHRHAKLASSSTADQSEPRRFDVTEARPRVQHGEQAGRHDVQTHAGHDESHHAGAPTTGSRRHDHPSGSRAMVVTPVSRTRSSGPARPWRDGGPARPGRVRPARRGSAREPPRCAAALPARARGSGPGCWSPRRAAARRRPGPAAGCADRATTPTTPGSMPRSLVVAEQRTPAVDDVEHLDDAGARAPRRCRGCDPRPARPATGRAGQRQGSAGRTPRPPAATPHRRHRAACSSRRPRAREPAAAAASCHSRTSTSGAAASRCRTRRPTESRDPSGEPASPARGRQGRGEGPRARDAPGDQRHDSAHDHEARVARVQMRRYVSTVAAS